MNKSDATRLARSLMNRHGFGHIPFEFDRGKSRLGACHFTATRQGGRIVDAKVKKITLSALYVELLPENEIREVILHEIAHAMTPGDNHGYAWKRAARSLGIKGDRCAKPSASPEATWIGRCKNGHESKQHRAPGRVKACGKCAAVWKPENVLVWERGGKIYNHLDIPSSKYRQEVLLLSAKGRL